jgi:hypothetical protein
MRTTLSIDEDILRAAKSIADAENKSIGRVVSELARRGLAPTPIGEASGLPVFQVPPHAAPLTPEMVRQALDD